MEARELTATVRRRNGAAVIDLGGELNAAAEAVLADAYAEAVGEGVASVVLNFADTEYINSTGIALIVGLLAQARSRNVEMYAVGLSDHYREIFEITRLADFMQIANSEQDALNGAEGNPHA